MENYLNLITILLLISAIVLVGNKRMNSYIRTFRVQSFLLALLAGIIGINGIFKGEGTEMLIVCALTLAIKVYYIPKLLTKTVKNVEYKVEKDFFLSIPISIIICFGLVVLTYYSINSVEAIQDSQIKSHLVNSVAVMLIGLFFMISRKKAIGQIVGFLVIENGLFMAAVLSTQGMPMIIELGIFFDVLTAVLIMGLLVFKINENFDSIDINRLRNLRG